MTKEPKLHSAVRIVTEWTDLDNEVRRLQERVSTASSKSEPVVPGDELNFLTGQEMVNKNKFFKVPGETNKRKSYWQPRVWTVCLKRIIF